jgi:purine-binding chemotaxis protein CheW
MTFYDRFSPEEIAILRQRALRVAQASQDDDQVQSISALTIYVYDEVYALPVESLMAVYEDVQVVPVPCVPSHISGIVNVRGHIIPVLDLSVLLSVAPKDMPSRTLAIAGNGQHTVGLLVTRLGDVVHFMAQDMDAVPANFDARQARYIQGVLQDGTALLKLPAIINDESLVVVAEAAMA